MTSVTQTDVFSHPLEGTQAFFGALVLSILTSVHLNLKSKAKIGSQPGLVSLA